VIKLSYCTFGLTHLDLLSAIDAVDKTGYPGIELSFHRDQFNPFEISDEFLTILKKHFETTSVKPACVATASHFFTPSRPHEPSLMCIDLAGRKRRINLIKRGIQVARKLEIPLVTFGSGFIREEHIAHPEIDPRELLVDSIQQCLGEIREGEDITLLIEPEPGMFIETLEQGIGLVDDIASPSFRLHLDLCHNYCSEKNCISALAKAAPYARYLHVSDAEEGYNLKFLRATENPVVDLDFAAYLLYYTETAEFLLLDRLHPIYFYDSPPTSKVKRTIEETMERLGILSTACYIDYDQLFAGSTPYDDEIFTYLISVPGLSFEVLERAKPILAYLRGTFGPDGRKLVDKMVANTLTGIVHFHEIPGEGTLDFEATFKALNENGFSGYASVELYHHVASWEKALTDSFQHLCRYIDTN
jgi:sugar phosphate isomerase/epimerase